MPSGYRLAGSRGVDPGIRPALCTTFSQFGLPVSSGSNPLAMKLRLKLEGDASVYRVGYPLAHAWHDLA